MMDGTLLRDAIISGANHILQNKKMIDELNVFPVPDGDTGTNMSMTRSAAAKELGILESVNAADIAKTAASAMLRGARGNSGVILSLLFKGFSRGLEGKLSATGEDLVDALALGVEAAYKAVMKPTEGTILTVARIACERGREAVAESPDLTFVWRAVCDGAWEALADTPKLLPVLKKAGVVDAGGKGLCLIFEGMLSVIRDGIILDAAAEGGTPEMADDFFRNAAAEFDQEITFTYCTECIIGREPEKKEDSMELRSYLEEIGDSVVIADDDDIIKVHVHTETPGSALQKALEFGQLLTVKIENMKEQHRIAAQANELAKAKTREEALRPVEPTEEHGFVAVAAGDGLQTLFTDLGCDQVVSGGQTMNPSTNDILAAVVATPAKKVFVFPNNKNIILAAEQTVPLVVDREVIVVPTRTIPQGMSALLAFDPEASPERNLEDMMEAASNVETGQVTFAARDSEFGGQKIKKGEILGLLNGKMVMVGNDPLKTAYRLTRSMIKRDTAFVTLIYGEDISEREAGEIRDRISAKAGNDTEVTLIDGGQPIYSFIISVE